MMNPEHLMDTGWQERRRKILETREQEERDRTRRIQLARRLEEGWKLARICKEFIRENSRAWQEMDEKREQEIRERKKRERLDKAKKKREEFTKKKTKEAKILRIDELLQEMPRSEKDKLEYEMRKMERKEYIEVKQNLWRKWRGKQEIMERKKQDTNRDGQN